MGVTHKDRFTFGGHATPEFDAPGRALLARSLGTGLAPDTAQAFRSALETLSVDTVCSLQAIAGDPVEEELAATGFVVVDTTDTCVYWRR